MDTMTDEYWMKRALELAQMAKHQGEIPVGAVVILEGQIVSEAFNEKEHNTDATAHAEILAIQRASQRLGRWRLSGCQLYVTLEPCFMCVGAVISARVDRLIYGATDKKAGAVESTYQLEKTSHFNHYPQIAGGVLEADCSQILKNFFQELRESRGR